MTLVFLVFFLSLYLLPFFAVRGVKPDLGVLLVLFYAFRVDHKKAPLFSFGVGFLKDLFSTRFFGIEIFSLGFVTLLLSYVLGKVEREEPINLVVSTALFSVLYEILACASYIFLNGDYSLWPEFVIMSLWRSLYTVAVFPAFFILFQSIAEGRRNRLYEEV